MSDLLERIARREDDIVREWSRALRKLPNSPYALMDEDALALSIRRSCQALLHVMQTGNTDSMTAVLQDSARRRVAEGIRFSDTIAAWLLYRQVVQEVLGADLHDPDAWEQLVDRVSAVLDWVMRTIYAVYETAGQFED
jgi:hypothetical protein